MEVDNFSSFVNGNVACMDMINAIYNFLFIVELRRMIMVVIVLYNYVYIYP